MVLRGESVMEHVVHYVHCIVRYIRRIHCNKNLLGFVDSARPVTCLTVPLMVVGWKKERETA
jgi:hypothetical protein